MGRDGYEHEFIEQIVKQVARVTKPITLPVADGLVGLQSPMKSVISLLNVRSHQRVHMVGIHGISGIGKTTFTLKVYNLISNQFEGMCFLEKVRKTWFAISPKDPSF